ncbi:hypothetical protein Syun_018343 [Stephania yunnanensis]|uniref:Uncharacterized protein n=1 Tax=Stephania yunnanensis TaxID=152371 RepID=A0AAP0IS48_9MAGN
MPKSVKHGKQSLFLSKDFALDTEGSKYSDSSSIPKDGFSRLLDLMTIPNCSRDCMLCFFRLMTSC